MVVKISSKRTIRGGALASKNPSIAGKKTREKEQIVKGGRSEEEEGRGNEAPPEYEEVLEGSGHVQEDRRNNEGEDEVDKDEYPGLSDAERPEAGVLNVGVRTLLHAGEGRAFLSQQQMVGASGLERIKGVQTAPSCRSRIKAKSRLEMEDQGLDQAAETLYIAVRRAKSTRWLNVTNKYVVIVKQRKDPASPFFPGYFALSKKAQRSDESSKIRALCNDSCWPVFHAPNSTHFDVLKPEEMECKRRSIPGYAQSVFSTSQTAGSSRASRRHDRRRRGGWRGVRQA
ncbi:hypothetical protein R3P38DRAFT_2766906 [Favolaschia claudopus]|uniref:Uncharacterized protein n=1 Tax=Favolaschia claudopus TaxID=2862362 RepID=A0AAW0CYA4_9AGAR